MCARRVQWFMGAGEAGIGANVTTIVVNLLGIVLIGFIVWWFLIRQRLRVRGEARIETNHR